MKVIDCAIDNDLVGLKEVLSRDNVNEIDSTNGYSALHYCAQNGNYKMAEYLLDKGADVTLKDNFGNTALFKAVFFSKGNPEIIKLLLRAGADASSKNNSGVSPKELAENIADFDVTSCFE